MLTISYGSNCSPAFFPVNRRTSIIFSKTGPEHPALFSLLFQVNIIWMKLLSFFESDQWAAVTSLGYRGLVRPKDWPPLSFRPVDMVLGPFEAVFLILFSQSRFLKGSFVYIPALIKLISNYCCWNSTIWLKVISNYLVCHSTAFSWANNQFFNFITFLISQTSSATFFFVLWCGPRGVGNLNSPLCQA